MAARPIRLNCVRPERLEDVQHELEAIGLTGITVTEVRGAGRQAGYVERYRGMEYRVRLLAKAKIEVRTTRELRRAARPSGADGVRYSRAWVCRPLTDGCSMFCGEAPPIA